MTKKYDHSPTTTASHQIVSRGVQDTRHPTPQSISTRKHESEAAGYAQPNRRLGTCFEVHTVVKPTAETGSSRCGNEKTCKLDTTGASLFVSANLLLGPVTASLVQQPRRCASWRSAPYVRISPEEAHGPSGTASSSIAARIEIRTHR